MEPTRLGLRTKTTWRLGKALKGSEWSGNTSEAYRTIDQARGGGLGDIPYMDGLGYREP